MLAWTNSYNKQVAFNCTSGAYVVNSGNLMIGNYGTLNKFRRNILDQCKYHYESRDYTLPYKLANRKVKL